jgi:large subunit ribosomal protein L18
MRDGGKIEEIEMIKKQYANQARLRRHQRVRKKVAGTAARPRLSVFRSATHIYAQVINDEQGGTLLAASSRDADIANPAKGAASLPAGDEAAAAIKGLTDNRLVRQAWLVGLLIAQRAKAQGIEKVVFDRGGYIYHGRVAALAEGARKGGLDF